MDIEKLAHDVQEAAANTKFEKYLLSDEPVRNREEREDVLLQRRLDEDTKKSREVAVKNQQQLQVEYNRINRNIDLQFATLLAQTHSGLKVPRPQMEGLHGVGGNGGRPLVGPQVLTSAVLDENAAGGILSHASGYMSGDIRSPGLTTKKSVEKSRNKPREESTRADLRPTGSTYFSARPQQNVSTTAGRALPGPPPPSHRSGPSVFSSQSVSNYAIAFPVPFEESGFTSVIRWADIAYEEAVVAALGPGADFIALRQKEMPSRVLVTVTCYVLNEILSRDSHLRDVWHKLRTPLFDAVYSPQMVGVQMVKRGETALQQKKSGAKEKSIRKIFLQSDEEMEEEKRGKCGYLESIPASSTACGWNGSSGTMEERNGVTQPYERENMESFPDSRESKKNKEEEEYGVVPSFPARYVQYTNQHDYASYCLWTEEMLQVKRLNNALAKRVSELKEVVQKSRLVLDLAGRRVDRYRKQFIFCAWRSYVASMGRCRRTATNYIIRQKNNRLVESCFLKWRRVPLQEKVDHLESQVGELKRKLQMSNEIHQSEMNALRAKGKVAQDKLQDLTLKDEALRNQMLESHRLETTGLQSALTKSTKKAIQLREHSRRWERLAKTSRPMLLCRSVPKPLLSTAIDLCALEEEIFSHPISGWGSLAEAHPSFARQAVPLLEQLLCHWVNFIMQGSPSHKSWVPVVGCAKKLNASSPPALLQRSNGPDSGRGPGSARGHTGFASRPQTFRGQVEGGERASTALDNRVGSRSRSSFSYPTMNQMASSSPGSKSALCAALLGPLPDALESGQLSPLGLLMVVRELRRLLPIEVMDLERELGQANTVALAHTRHFLRCCAEEERKEKQYIASLHQQGFSLEAWTTPATHLTLPVSSSPYVTSCSSLPSPPSRKRSRSSSSCSSSVDAPPLWNAAAPPSSLPVPEEAIAPEHKDGAEENKKKGNREKDARTAFHALVGYFFFQQRQQQDALREEMWKNVQHATHRLTVLQMAHQNRRQGIGKEHWARHHEVEEEDSEEEEDEEEKTRWKDLAQVPLGTLSIADVLYASVQTQLEANTEEGNYYQRHHPLSLSSSLSFPTFPPVPPRTFLTTGGVLSTWRHHLISSSTPPFPASLSSSRATEAVAVPSSSPHALKTLHPSPDDRCHHWREILPKDVFPLERIPVLDDIPLRGTWIPAPTSVEPIPSTSSSSSSCGHSFPSFPDASSVSPPHDRSLFLRPLRIPSLLCGVTYAGRPEKRGDGWDMRQCRRPRVEQDEKRASCRTGAPEEGDGRSHVRGGQGGQVTTVRLWGPAQRAEVPPSSAGKAEAFEQRRKRSKEENTGRISSDRAAPVSCFPPFSIVENPEEDVRYFVHRRYMSKSMKEQMDREHTEDAGRSSSTSSPFSSGRSKRYHEREVQKERREEEQEGRASVSLTSIDSMGTKKETKKTEGKLSVPPLSTAIRSLDDGGTISAGEKADGNRQAMSDTEPVLEALKQKGGVPILPIPMPDVEWRYH